MAPTSRSPSLTQMTAMKDDASSDKIIVNPVGELFEDEDKSYLTRLNHPIITDKLAGEKVVRWRIPIKDYNATRLIERVRLPSPLFKIKKFDWRCYFEIAHKSNLANFFIELENGKQLGYFPYRALMGVSFRDVGQKVHLIPEKSKNCFFASEKKTVMYPSVCTWKSDGGISVGNNDADVIKDVVDIIVCLRLYHKSETGSSNIPTQKSVKPPLNALYSLLATEMPAPNVVLLSNSTATNEVNNPNNAIKTSTPTKNGASSTNPPFEASPIDQKSSNMKANHSNGSSTKVPSQYERHETRADQQSNDNCICSNDVNSKNSTPACTQPPDHFSTKPLSTEAPLELYRRVKRIHYVGLNNQGATCYMNSILQSLFFIVPFRSFITTVASRVDKSTSHRELNALRALSDVFKTLKSTAQSVSTRALTKSFGWDSEFTFRQQDPQEFIRCLFEFLENGYKMICTENIIKHLFEGEMETRVECKHISFSSKRIETFNDIQLNVDGCPDLEAAFREYTAKEDLTGENQYQADDFGLQDAVKYIRFKTLPPVLHLQLKRFHYDVQRYSMRKIHSRQKFPKRLDLTSYMSVDASPKWPQIYVLQGVLVHSGSISGGHYRAYLRPSVDEAWFEFDDESVFKLDYDQVEKAAAGGDSSSRSAYMLIYIRENAMDMILEDSDDYSNGRDTPYSAQASNDFSSDDSKSDDNSNLASKNGFNHSGKRTTRDTTTEDFDDLDESNAKRVKLHEKFDVEGSKSMDNHQTIVPSLGAGSTNMVANGAEEHKNTIVSAQVTVPSLKEAIEVPRNANSKQVLADDSETLADSDSTHDQPLSLNLVPSNNDGNSPPLVGDHDNKYIIKTGDNLDSK